MAYRLLYLASPMLRGPDVFSLQRAIGAKADGIFGPATKDAVQRYQANSGLRVTGTADESLQRQLGVQDKSGERPPNPFITKPPTEGQAVPPPVAAPVVSAGVIAAAFDQAFAGRGPKTQPIRRPFPWGLLLAGAGALGGLLIFMRRKR